MTWVVFCSATHATIHLDYSVKGVSWGRARTLQIAVGSGPRGEGRAQNQEGSKQTNKQKQKACLTETPGDDKPTEHLGNCFAGPLHQLRSQEGRSGLWAAHEGRE